MQIPLNKSKIVLMLVGSLAFVAIGTWFIISPPQLHNPVLGNRIFLIIIGAISILFFGICAVFFLHKLQDPKPGLIIDENGLMDNSSGVAAGLIPWSDIQKFVVIEIHRQKIIMVFVKDPQHYIDKAGNGFKRKLVTMNFKLYGSPISISANSLKISHDELFAVLMQNKALY
jgi:hypothetical protein